MSIHFWIASHLGNTDRIVMLKGMLASIANQKDKPDHVCISMSHSDDILVPSNGEIAEILGNITFTLFVSGTKLHQFQHLKRIYDSFGEKVKWVMFCDDDDLNGPERVSSFRQVLSENPDKTVFTSGTTHFYNNLYRKDEPWIIDYNIALSRGCGSVRCDFGSYICHISVLREFFDTMYENKIDQYCGHMDVLFMAWIRSVVLVPGIHYLKRHGGYPRDYQGYLPQIGT